MERERVRDKIEDSASGSKINPYGRSYNCWTIITITNEMRNLHMQKGYLLEDPARMEFCLRRTQLNLNNHWEYSFQDLSKISFMNLIKF